MFSSIQLFFEGFFFLHYLHLINLFQTLIPHIRTLFSILNLFWPTQRLWDLVSKGEGFSNDGKCLSVSISYK